MRIRAAKTQGRAAMLDAVNKAAKQRS